MLNLQPDQESQLLSRIDQAIIAAAEAMDLDDLPDDDTEEVYELRDLALDERHHCGTCQVRTVMEIVWPAIDDYITYLKGNHAAEH